MCVKTVYTDILIIFAKQIKMNKAKAFRVGQGHLPWPQILDMNRIVFSTITKRYLTYKKVYNIGPWSV